MHTAFCFVLMPFGRKPDTTGMILNFDAIYQKIIKPAIESVNLHPIRSDEEKVGGVIHKPMYERLILSEFALADLTIANPNVYYELGIRHAVRPRTTVLVFAENTRLPFDLGPLRGLPYHINKKGIPDSPKTDIRLLREFLQNTLESKIQDSPLFNFVEGMPPPDISLLKTDLFQKQVEYSAQQKERLSIARREGIEALRAVKVEMMEPIQNIEPGVLIDLMLSFRALTAWKDMIALVEEMPESLSNTAMVQEQYAFALNRDGQGERAEHILLDLLKNRGPSSETYGILGRVYKDRWANAIKTGKKFLSQGLLDKSIDTYLKGFHSDWRDAYPGMNAITLMELKEPPDERQKELIPVVAYSIKRHIESGEPNYWDYASLLELAVIESDQDKATDALANTLAAVREVWEPKTTLLNIRLIRKARKAQGESTQWISEVEEALEEMVPE